MSRRIELTLTYNTPAADVHRALTSREFWGPRIEKLADSSVTLDRLEGGDGTIDVAISQVVDKAGLPALVAKGVKGDIVLTRAEQWGPFEGGTATGNFTVTTTGLPITAKGSAVLSQAGEQSTLTIDGTVDVAIKIIGGAIEGMVSEQVIDILKRDQHDIEEWLAAQA